MKGKKIKQEKRGKEKGNIICLESPHKKKEKKKKIDILKF